MRRNHRPGPKDATPLNVSVLRAVLSGPARSWKLLVMVSVLSLVTTACSGPRTQASTVSLKAPAQVSAPIGTTTTYTTLPQVTTTFSSAPPADSVAAKALLPDGCLVHPYMTATLELKKTVDVLDEGGPEIPNDPISTLIEGTFLVHFGPTGCIPDEGMFTMQVTTSGGQLVPIGANPLHNQYFSKADTPFPGPKSDATGPYVGYSDNISGPVVMTWEWPSYCGPRPTLAHPFIMSASYDHASITFPLVANGFAGGKVLAVPLCLSEVAKNYPANQGNYDLDYQELIPFPLPFG